MTRTVGVLRIVLVVGVVLGLGALAALGGRPGLAATHSAAGARPAQASPEHRAVVVVDTGSEVRTACVRFREASISGTEALRRAGMDPVLRSYGGQGTAVCALCGKGCPADGSCLTCGGTNYWNYFRKLANASAFTYSRSGAGSVQVRDGDVEGWTWGNGAVAPPLALVDSVCGAATVDEPVAVGGAAGEAPGTPSSVPTNGGSAAAADAPADPAAAASASTTAPVQVAGTAERREAASGNAERAVARQGGSPILFIVVAAGIALLVALLVWWAGRRRIGSPS